MENLNKYQKVKQVKASIVNNSKDRNFQSNFDISDYPGYDDIINIQYLENGMIVTIGKLKKEKKDDSI